MPFSFELTSAFVLVILVDVAVLAKATRIQLFVLAQPWFLGPSVLEITILAKSLGVVLFLPVLAGCHFLYLLAVHSSSLLGYLLSFDTSLFDLLAHQLEVELQVLRQ